LFPVALGCQIAAVTAWAGSLALIALPLYAGALPGGTAKFWLFEAGPGLSALAEAGDAASKATPASWLATLVGAAGLAVVAPWVTVGAANLQAAISRRLLGRTSEAEMAELLRRSEGRRSAAVDSAETERRRIERDLHDGAQAQLVALGMNLGLAQELVTRDPAAAADLIAEARVSSSTALSDLRSLVRGIHPPVLADRGLAGAVEALALAHPRPVETDIVLDGRPPAPVESAVYFAVAEMLTNSAKYAAAQHTWVWIRHDGGVLTVMVGDDGVGGAEPTVEGGLAGVQRRLAAFDGTLSVASPLGGGTIVTVKVPCVLRVSTAA
jgi:signal transduction histidine kinase